MHSMLTCLRCLDFFLNLGNGQRIEFKRPRASASQTIDYLIFGSYCSFGVAAGTMDAATRSYFVAYLKSDNLVIFWLGIYNTSSISNAFGFGIMLRNNNNTFTYTTRSLYPLNYTLVGPDSSVTFAPTINYNAGAGNVDFAEKAVFVSGGSKAFETEEIKSCSTMSQFASIALPDGRNLFTIATNAMVEIDPTT